MQGAEAPDEIAAGDADDAAVGEELAERVQGDAVVGVGESWDEDEAVGDVEICVARGEALVVENYGRGHREGDDTEWLAVLIGCGAEAGEIFVEDFVVVIGGIGLDCSEDRVFRDEAGDVVDVAVGVIADDAAVEPDDFVDA